MSKDEGSSQYEYTVTPHEAHIAQQDERKGPAFEEKGLTSEAQQRAPRRRFSNYGIGFSDYPNIRTLSAIKDEKALQEEYENYSMERLLKLYEHNIESYQELLSYPLEITWENRGEVIDALKQWNLAYATKARLASEGKIQSIEDLNLI